MPRKPSGEVALQRALSAAADARSAQDLRIALAVLLPLRFGATLNDTASVLGRSKGWISSRRRDFIAGATGRRPSGVDRQGGRRNELMPLHAEDAFMDRVCKVYTNTKVQWLTNVTSGPEHYAESCRPFVYYVQRALVELAGRPVSKATAYNLMARVGVRRFYPYHASTWTSYCKKGLPV